MILGLRGEAMRRREFITLLGGAAAWPLAARAQTKRARIGWFTVAPHPYIDGFRQGLRELGWIEGENLAIEPIYADGHPERLPGLASVLARVPYDLVVASGSDAVEAARAAIQSIPIVGVSSSMGTGGSLARSEGNLSGIALLFDEGRHQVAGAADRNGSARTGRFVERDDALTCLRHMRAGAEVLQICRIGGDGAGLLGIGPGLLVGLLARLLIGRLLLRRLLRIRGLAASRRQRSPSDDDCDDRQFRKCDTSSVLGLLTPIISHGWPFPGFTRGPLYLQRPRASPVQYVPKRTD